MIVNPNLVTAFLSKNLSNYIKILEKMVSINSHTENSLCVNALGDLTYELFAPFGFSKKQVQSSNPKFGKHLLMIAGNLSAPSIGLISHLDTVYSLEEEQTNNFKFRIENDFAYGPGTFDIKGGTLVIYMLMDALYNLYPQFLDKINLQVLLNAAEEKADLFFGTLCKESLGKNALAALVFEGGSEPDGTSSLVVARKGIAIFKIKVFGKGAHAGSSHKYGVSAIHELSNLIQKVFSLTDYSKELTANVGLISGGSAHNRVAHYAEAELEIRCYEPKILEQAFYDLKRLMTEKIVKNLAGESCEIQLEHIETWNPWAENHASNKLFDLFQNEAKKINFDLTASKRGGGSDGNNLWDFCPTIDGLGPLGGNAHCSVMDKSKNVGQEYIKISSLVPKATISLLGICRIASCRSAAFQAA